MKRFISVLVPAVALVLLTACGATGVAGAGNPPSPSPSTGNRFDVSVTEMDHAVTVRVGQTVEVVLHKSNGLNDWSHPSSNNTSILLPVVDTAGTAARGVSLAAFVAKAPGTVDITASASPVCPSTGACPMHEAVYSLKVTVTQ